MRVASATQMKHRRLRSSALKIGGAGVALAIVVTAGAFGAIPNSTNGDVYFCVRETQQQNDVFVYDNQRYPNACSDVNGKTVQVPVSGQITGGDIQDGSLTGADVQDGSLTGADIQDDSLTSADLAPNSVFASELGDNSVDNAALQDNAVGPAELADNSVGNSELQDNSVGNAEMQDNSVGNAELQANSVGNAELQDNAVGTNEVANNSLSSDDIGPNAVGSSEVTDGSLRLVDLAGGQVEVVVDFPAVPAAGGDFCVSQDVAVPDTFGDDELLVDPHDPTLGGLNELQQSGASIRGDVVALDVVRLTFCVRDPADPGPMTIGITVFG